MRWTGISVATPTASTEEAVVSLLMNAGCSGVALAGEAENRIVTSYLPADDVSKHKLSQILAAFALLPTLGIEDAGIPAIVEIDEEDWANSWKAYFKPIRIGKKLIVSPPWETPTLSADDHLITIDPGMAFGTGTHATTQMCMVFLEELLIAGETVADIGTGSGILSITASKLGGKNLVAVDNDLLAVKIARENALVNGSEVAVSDNFPFGQQFDVVVANIIADTLIALRDELASIMKQSGILIVSGVIDVRQDDVRSAIETAGLTSLSTKTQGEWVAMAFRKNSEAI